MVEFMSVLIIVILSIMSLFLIVMIGFAVVECIKECCSKDSDLIRNNHSSGFIKRGVTMASNIPLHSSDNDPTIKILRFLESQIIHLEDRLASLETTLEWEHIEKIMSDGKHHIMRTKLADEDGLKEAVRGRHDVGRDSLRPNKKDPNRNNFKQDPW